MKEPYLLADCYETNCHSGKHYHVQRSDGAKWVICQDGAGRWEIERAHPSEALPSFPSEDDAARFASMEGRFYCASVTAPSSERLQVRVVPNFGYWRNWPSGQWVASLHRENGDICGFSGGSDSLTKTKAIGLRGALSDPNLTEDEALRLDWHEIDVRDAALGPADPFRPAT
jgi:hypothetical protein